MKWLVFISFILISTAIHAQWSLEGRIEIIDLKDAAVDNVGNLYLISTNGDISKYDSRGNFMTDFSPSFSAQLDQIQLTSQMRALLFYKDLQEFVLVNRLLSNPVRYKLMDMGMNYVSALLVISQQNMWAVDQTDFSLKFIDFRTKQVIERKSLSQLVNQEYVEHIRLHTDGNRLFLFDPTTGVLVFDNIGNYLATIPVQTNSQKVQFFKDILYYHEDDKLVLLSLSTNEVVYVELPKIEFSKIVLGSQQVLLLDDKGVDIYKYLSGDFFDHK